VKMKIVLSIGLLSLMSTLFAQARNADCSGRSWCQSAPPPARVPTVQPSRSTPPAAYSAPQYVQLGSQPGQIRSIDQIRQILQRSNINQFGPTTLGPNGSGDVQGFLNMYRQAYSEPEFQQTRANFERQGVHVPTPDELERVLLEGSVEPAGPLAPSIDPILETQTANDASINGTVDEALRAIAPSDRAIALVGSEIGSAASLHLPELGDMPNLGNCSLPEDAGRIADLRFRRDAYRTAVAANQSARLDVAQESGAGDAVEEYLGLLGGAQILKGTADTAKTLIGSLGGETGQQFQIGMDLVENGITAFTTHSQEERVSSTSEGLRNVVSLNEKIQNPSIEVNGPIKNAVDRVDIVNSFVNAGKTIGEGSYNIMQRQAEGDRLRGVNTSVLNMIDSQRTDLLQKLADIEAQLDALTQCTPTIGPPR
jgi:hypothetical protein